MKVTFEQLKQWIKSQAGKDSKNFKGQPWHPAFWVCLNNTEKFCDHYLKFPHGFAETDHMNSKEEALEYLLEFNFSLMEETTNAKLQQDYELKLQQKRGSHNSTQLGRHTARLWYLINKQVQEVMGDCYSTYSTYKDNKIINS
jgi:hypothetical protein